MAVLLPQGRQQFFDAAGAPLAGGKVHTYAAGTSTPQATYTDAAGAVANANPVVLNARGEAIIFWAADAAYKVVVTDADGATIWTQDDVSNPGGGPSGSANVGFIQSGAGAVARSLQTVVREGYRSIKCQGATGDGATSDRTAIENAVAAHTGVTKQLRVPAGTYVSNNTTVNQPQAIMGDGGELISTVNTTVGTLIIGDSADPTVQAEPVFLWNMRFRWTVAPVDDNRATLNVTNTRVGIFGGYWKDTSTLARIGHINAGDQATAEGSVVVGATGKGVQNFGIEHIGSGYSRIIGMGLDNDGVKIGQHGIRWSGFVGYVKRGNVAVGNVLKDRGTCGLSIQAYQENCVAVGNVMDNVVNGVVANVNAEYEGRHMLAGNLIAGASSDSANLNRMSGTFFEALIDRCAAGTVAIRQQVDSNGTRIDAMVHGGASALRNAGTGHLIDLIGNQQTSEVAVLGCSWSHARIVCRGTGTTSTNTVQVTGSNNIIEVVDPDGADPSVRIEAGADNNVLIVNTNGNVRVLGNGNVVYGRCGGTIAVTGDDNKILAKAASFSDAGSGNDFRGAPGASAYGSTSVTTSGAGVATIAHGLSITPRNVRGTVRGAGSAYIISANAPGGANISFTVWDAAGVLAASVALTIDWEASL